MKLSELKVDASRIEQGEWVENIPDMGDLRLKVRGLGNTAYRRMQTKLVDAIPRAKRAGGRIDPDELDRVTAQCLHATVLEDWENLDEPYSKDLAIKLLTDPDYRRFRDAVVWAADRVGEQAAVQLEDDVKN